MAMSSEGAVKEFYPQDLVYKFDNEKHIILGVVSDWHESDENVILQKDQVVVLWNNNNRKQICRHSKLHLMSRNLEFGDVVRRLEDGKETQRGYIRKIEQYATVQIVQSDKVIEHVANERLCFVKPFEIGDAVCLEDKFGRVQNVEYTLRMQSKCGSIVEVCTSINFAIHDYWNRAGKLDELGYPGQVVVCIPMCLRGAKWIKKSKSMMRKVGSTQTFTIVRIEPNVVEIWWYSPSGYMEEITDDDIKRLKVLAYSENVIIGDRQFLKLKSSDVAIKKKEWRMKKFNQFYSEKVPKNDDNQDKSEEIVDADDDWFTEDDTESGMTANSSKRPKIRSRRRRSMLSKCTPGAVVAVEVLCTDIKATVIWQDGSEEKNIPTTQLYYSVALDDHEFFPGECVISSTTNVTDKYGVIQKVHFLERTASIKWFSYCEADKKPKELSTDEMSVYDVKLHPKFLFRPGTVVRSKPVRENRMGKVIDSCPEGYVIVHWLDDGKENCWPQHLDVIPDSEQFDYPDEFFSVNDLSDDAYSWETESVESYEGDVIDDVNLQLMASRVEFIRSRIAFLMEATRDHNIANNFQFVKELLCIYDNSSYLDKYLGTSFFTLNSKHFQALLAEAMKKAKSMGIELRGRLFSSTRDRCAIGGPSTQSEKMKLAEQDNIEKIIKMENKVNAQIESYKGMSQGETCMEKPVPLTPNITIPPSVVAVDRLTENNLCVELLHMLKLRMDLVYAEILSRIGSRDALTALTDANENPSKASSSVVNLPNAPLSSLISESRPPPIHTSLNDKPPPKSEAFSILEEAPDTHRYYSSKFEPKDMLKFTNTLQKEYRLLKDSLPAGVWVRTYESRIDLLSVMIRGPAKTPYEDGLFLFDIQLCPDYPKNPPSVHYISYIGHALNPNLYVEGKVCVSLLGTWTGKGSEVWGPNSTLLQLIVSIQGLILVAEPFYNEAGYERHANTQQGSENSRTYNEFVLLKLVQSMSELLNARPKIFHLEISEHFKENGERMCERLLMFCEDDCALQPEFPLLPVSKGLKLSLRSAVGIFRNALKSALSNQFN